MKCHHCCCSSSTSPALAANKIISNLIIVLPKSPIAFQSFTKRQLKTDCFSFFFFNSDFSWFIFYFLSSIILNFKLLTLSIRILINIKSFEGNTIEVRPPPNGTMRRLEWQPRTCDRYISEWNVGRNVGQVLGSCNWSIYGSVTGRFEVWLSYWLENRAWNRRISIQFQRLQKANGVTHTSSSTTSTTATRSYWGWIFVRMAVVDALPHNRNIK